MAGHMRHAPANISPARTQQRRAVAPPSDCPMMKQGISGGYLGRIQGLGFMGDCPMISKASRGDTPESRRLRCPGFEDHYLFLVADSDVQDLRIITSS
jgi:hypothetical protein